MASVAARCSHCLALTTHARKDKAMVGRDVYTCGASGCKKQTVQCKRCMPEPRGSASGSMLRLSGTSSRPEVLEQGMAKDGMMAADDYCVVCEGILGVWPSPMDDDVALLRTGSGRMVGSVSS